MPTSNTASIPNHILPHLVLTPGEPAGIGPDLAITIARRQFNFALTVIADPELLQARAHLLGQKLGISEHDPANITQHQPNHLSVLPLSLDKPVEPGAPDPANASYLLASLDRAIDGCLDKSFSAMVTGPINKAVINAAGIPFSGHTEYLAGRCGNNAHPAVMMLTNKHLRVALVTTHLPLQAVPAAITDDRLKQVIHIVNRDLQEKFAIPRPRLLVCGLNPHAGEQGYLGREEIEIIQPVIHDLQQAGLDLIGPVPADTAFTNSSLAGIDAVICMYHDQGLPVLKAQGFGETVNITLGLPVIRTSVDHGTAFELAGTGRADAGSLATALEVAGQLSSHFQPA